MSYYYLKSDGALVDSSRKIVDARFTPLTEAEYMISRLLVRGYKKSEIEQATKGLFSKMAKTKRNMTRK